MKSYKIQNPTVYNFKKTYSDNVVREKRPLLNIFSLKIMDRVHFDQKLCCLTEPGRWWIFWARKFSKCNLEILGHVWLNSTILQLYNFPRGGGQSKYRFRFRVGGGHRNLKLASKPKTQIWHQKPFHMKPNSYHWGGFTSIKPWCACALVPTAPFYILKPT